jgi:hypothetical protein
MALLPSLSLSARCTKCFQTFFTCKLSSSHTPAALHFSHFFAFFLLAVCLATISHLINTCLRRPNPVHLTIQSLKVSDKPKKRKKMKVMEKHDLDDDSDKELDRLRSQYCTRSKKNKKQED